jgi:hypothetical protein
MRNLVRVMIVGVFTLGVVAMGSSGAGAGVPVLTNSVTVLKVVEGPVPANTTFTVAVDCAEIVDGVATSAVSHTEITFDSTGQPTSPDTVQVDGGTECTASETANGGAASTDYACELEPDPGDAECTADDTVVFADVIGTAAAITVTNTFPTPTPPPLTPITPAAQAVQAAPTFTG